MIAVGLSVLIAARKAVDRRLIVRVAEFVFGKAGTVLDDEAARIHQPVALDRFGLGQSFGDHGRDDEVGNPCRSFARAEKKYASDP